MLFVVNQQNLNTKDVTITKINMKETYHKNSVFVNSF